MDTSELRRSAFLRAAEAQDVELQDFNDNVEVDTDDDVALHATVSGGPEEEVVAEDLPQPPTLEEIEAIQQEAWQEGYAEGKQQGFDEGLKEGRLKGAEQGLQQGLEQGRTQGFEAGQHEIVQRCAQLDELLVELKAPLEAVDDEVERELVTLAMKLAHAVVQVELRTSSDAVLHALRMGVAALPQQHQQLVIKANSEDKALLEQSYGADELKNRQWQLQLDPGLSKGSLNVETKRSDVAVITEERLRQALEHFASMPRAPVDEPQYPAINPISQPSQPIADSNAESDEPEDSHLAEQADASESDATANLSQQNGVEDSDTSAADAIQEQPQQGSPDVEQPTLGESDENPPQ